MENIEANLKRYRYLVVGHLKATDISLKLPTGIITIEERTELNRLAATSQALATEHILDILEKSKEPGKWQAFSEALQSADYPYLLEILKSTPKMGKHEDYYLKLIHVFANELQQCVVPMHILPYLLSKGVINEGDVQEITARQLSFGPQLAFLLLLDLLPRRQRPKIWYRHFLQGLLEADHKDLVEQIDPDYFSTQKLEPITDGKVKQGYTSSGASWDGCHNDTEEMECVMEDAVEPEYDSMGDQGAPSLSNPESCDMFDIKDQSEEICDIESSPVVSSSSSLTSSKIQASFFTPMKLAHSHDFRIPKNDSEEIDTTNKLDDRIKVDITSTNKLDTQPQRDKQMVYKPNVSVEDNCDESGDENFMTYDYDDEEDNEPPTKKMKSQDPLLQLRNYQIELAKIAVGGENTITCTPTGSGKTLVALHNIKKHLETTRPKDLLKTSRQAEDEAADSHKSESENDLASDYESSDEEKPESNQQEHGNPLLNLRNYQLELAEDALHGKNTIICAETGSGKTWVALYIVKNHLESAKPGKKLVAFMAITNPLIKQQHQRFVKYLPNYTTKLITGDSVHSTALDIFLTDCDIICFTPQILFNNLEKQTVSLSDFSLMILDECHHTKKDEAYNRLMRKYLMAKVKSNVSNLPQIVGLTASIGVGKSTSDDKAVDYIISVMANLDTCKLSTVEKYKEEVEKYISRPKEEKIEMKDRPDDLCKKRILQAMMDVQEKLQDACLFEASLVDIVQSKRPKDLNSQQYTQWAKNVERTAAIEVENSETSRLIISCVKYLSTFNEALELNSLLGIPDVCKFLARKFNPEKEQQTRHTPEERELFQIISKVQKDLGEYNKSKDQKNPNLETMSKMLRDMILGENTDQESRALVFVKARATCTALACYLEEILGKDGIHVHKLTGKAATPGDEGMTEAEQTETLNKFASGDYTVLVSTSVGGEGIDNRDCNIVISYNYAGNEITKIQMTGRGRKKGGKNIVMGYEKTLDVDKLSIYKGAMMYRAMESIKKIDPRSLQRKIKQFQKEEISKQEFRDRVLEKQIGMKKKGQFKLCCYKCSVEVIDGEDLRVLKGTYHVVIDKEFKHLIYTKPHKKPSERKIEGLKKADKIYCKNCGMDWGVYFTYFSLPLPTIKCESFKVRNSEDGKFSTYKNWLNLPFVIEACELSEITDLLDE